MARTRVRAAARKAQRVRDLVIGDAPAGKLTPQDVVAVGVRQVAREIAGDVEPGALWWRAPLQFVAEQMSVRVCRQRALGDDHRDDVAAYLLAGLQEFAVALASDFDREHYEAWVAALNHAASG